MNLQLVPKTSTEPSTILVGTATLTAEICRTICCISIMAWAHHQAIMLPSKKVNAALDWPKGLKWLVKTDCINLRLLRGSNQPLLGSLAP